MLEVKSFLRRPPDAVGRSELSRVSSLPGVAKIGIMPGHIHQQGSGWRGEPLGNPDLRGGMAAQRIWASDSRPAWESVAIRSTAPRSSTCLEAFAADEQTEAVVMIGEIGGTAEEEAAAWIEANYDRPVVGIHRWSNGPSGAPHGTCGGHRGRRQGNGKVKRWR